MNQASESIYPLKNANVVILCATPRLARALRQAHADAAVAASRSLWHAPQILTLGGWLDDLLETASLRGDYTGRLWQRLSAMQEAVLWEQCIAECLQEDSAAELFDRKGLAKTAMEANRWMVEWGLNVSAEAGPATPEWFESSAETQQFLRWQGAFRAWCASHEYLEPVRHLAWQISLLKQGIGRLPERIDLYGFDQIQPHLQALQQVLEGRGVAVAFCSAASMRAANACAATSLQKLPNAVAECRAAVAWAKARLQQKPEARLAVMVPELAKWRHTLADLLDEAFHPLSIRPDQVEMPRCYDFSLGTTLASVPLVDTALQLLQLAVQSAETAWQPRQAMSHMVLQDSFGRLLVSPYWSASNEAEARAWLDAQMRRELPLHVLPASLLDFVLQFQRQHDSVPLLSEHFAYLLGYLRQQPRRQLPSVWGHEFQTLLQSAAWPGTRNLSSHEFQAAQKWQEMLDQLQELDGLLGQVPAAIALARLQQACRNHIYQPEQSNTPQIQILGMLESLAQPLDGLWVMGMNDDVWPPPVRLNPLLPALAQRQAGSPNSSSEVQMDFARKVQQRLLQSAEQVVFSYAASEGDRQLRASPLLDSLGLAATETAPCGFSTLAEAIAAEMAAQKLQTDSGEDRLPAHWQLLEDALAPPVSVSERIRGGAALLKAQVLCPAWAFFQFRLGLRALETPLDGLDAQARGSLLHAVLAHFWQHHQPASLLAQSESERSAAIRQGVEQSVARVMEDFSSQHSLRFSDRWNLLKKERLLEHDRLCRLVTMWLEEHDLKRSTAFQVLACEHKVSVEIAGLPMTFIIDRVDGLADGSLVLIDYKTGKAPDCKNWASMRISEPQLPLYAVFLMQQPVAAVCFASVRLQGSGFSGVSAEADMLPGVRAFDAEIRKLRSYPAADFPDWPSVLQHWQQRLEATLQQFKAGQAECRFSDPTDLQYCEVLPLLRLPERALQFERLTRGGILA